MAEATKLAGDLFDYVYDAVSLSDTLELGYALTAPKGDFVVVLSLSEMKAAHPDTDKRIHMPNGLYGSPVNSEIGASLLAALPELLVSGDIKVSTLSNLPWGVGTTLMGACCVARSRTVRKSFREGCIVSLAGWSV